MNDAAEHVAKPEAVLEECLRLLAPGGRIYLNFPPYFHPYGAHLSDAIAIPWVHVFFAEKTLIVAYKKLVGGLPDGARRVALRISRRAVGSGVGGVGGDGSGGSGVEYLSFINRMTIRRFRGILSVLPADCPYYREVPLRRIFGPFARIPGLREFFTKMVVAVLVPKK
jgi:2-polyprenyl-3-methyl-5-hydroxy-6-metoxy-1,4-benzoquinol methylase